MKYEKPGAVQPPTPPGGSTIRYPVYTSDQWRGCMERFYGGLGKWDAPAGAWPREAGPAPGQEGCRCPMDLVMEVTRRAMDAKVRIPPTVVKAVSAWLQLHPEFNKPAAKAPSK